MQIGSFFFEFPVWIIRVETEGSHGFAITQVENQDCLAVFTDEDLVESYGKEHLPGEEIVPVRFDDAEGLAADLEDCLRSGFAHQVAFDPGKTVFVWPIEEVANILRIGEE